MSHSRPPDALRARLLEEIARTPAPTRDERRRYIAKVAGVALGFIALTLLATKGVIPGTRPPGLIVFSVVSSIAVATLLSLSALAGSRSMLGPSPRRLAVVSAVSAPLWALLIGVFAAFWPSGTHEEVAMHSDAACLLFMLFQGGGLLAALLLAKRRTDPLRPALTGLALGVVAGAWGFALAYVRCPHVTVAHGFMAHVGPALMLAGAGALLGRKVLTDR